jgi:DNA modification methylase
VTVRLMVGDCREQMALLEPNSIQTVPTSPPYWGLRDYSVPPLVWGGEPGHAHEWAAARTAGWHVGTATGIASSTLSRSAAEAQARNKTAITGNSMGKTCPCGAWLGSLGLEPTPELYIEHMVEVFRGVRRVLRDDGTVWLNLGDSYAGSGKGPSNSLNKGNLHSHEANHKASKAMRGMNRLQDAPTEWQSVPSGAKPKDLLMIPARVAMALQADGWYLRSQIPWLKRNCMPESVTDRPATAVEYVYLLSKSRTYYWDAAAVRSDVDPIQKTHNDRSAQDYALGTANGNGVPGNVNNKGIRSRPGPGGHHRRNSDWFFESWQGLMLDEQDNPLAFIVNPRPFKGAHFATFPPQLVEPMIKAASGSGDTVLDPFGGSGTVGLVADRLDRHAVLCELKPDYADMGTNRIVNDAPMFVELAPGVFLPRREGCMTLSEKDPEAPLSEPTAISTEIVDSIGDAGEAA